MSQRDCRLVIFDWDGTLSNSVDRIVECLQHAASETGLSIPTVAAGREIIGLGLKEALEQLFPGIDEPTFIALRQSYSLHYQSRDAQPAALYHGVQETLRHLKEMGMLLAVATGKSRAGLDRVLLGLDMQDYFDSSRCADETLSKPHPRMLHELLAEFDLAPHQAFMVGDTEYDMEMALRAGVPRLAVSYGAHDSGRLHRYGLVGCVDNIAEMIDLLF